MTTRLPFHEILPGAFQGLVSVNNHVGKMASEHGVPATLIELIKIRCSQMNGCAYCVDMHVGLARQAGETQRRLDLLVTWREAGAIFTEQERAALALAEAMTTLSTTQEVPDSVYDAAASVFTEEQLAVVAWAAAEIQAFNALNVTSRKALRE